MDDLVRWLGEQLDEDERRALAARDIEFCKDGRWIAKGPFEEGFGSIHSEAGEAILGEEESVPFAIADHAALHDPARVLREIDAKREQIAWCVEVLGDRDLSHYDETGSLKDDPDALAVMLAMEMLRLLALPYVTRPGYRLGWAPSD